MPPSVLQSYLDQFTATPGYECNTTTGAVILNANSIVSDEIRDFRERAAAVAKADRKWKEQILKFMDDPLVADRAGLPTHEEVLSNFENGHATFVPMIAAWRVAECAGLISSTEFQNLCDRQVALISARMMGNRAAAPPGELLILYQVGAAGRGRISLPI